MTEQKQPIKTKIILAIIKFLANLPLSFAKGLLKPIVWIQIVIPNKTKTVIDLNLKTCLPDLSEKARVSIRNKNIAYNAQLLAEIIYVWFHEYQQNRKLIGHVSGLKDFEKQVASILPSLTIRS